MESIRAEEVNSAPAGAGMLSHPPAGPALSGAASTLKALWKYHSFFHCGEECIFYVERRAVERALRHRFHVNTLHVICIEDNHRVSVPIANKSLFRGFFFPRWEEITVNLEHVRPASC